MFLISKAKVSFTLSHSWKYFVFVKQIIKKFKLTTKKSLGQNYILDQNITNKVTNLIEIKNQIVLEIGPGPGCLTRSLIDKGAKKIIAVEKDQKCINALEYQKKKFFKKLIIIKIYF